MAALTTKFLLRPNTNLKPKDIICGAAFFGGNKFQRTPNSTEPKYNYLYREVFNCTEERSQEILHEFYFSDEFRNLEPIEGSQEAMKKLRVLFDKMYIQKIKIRSVIKTSIVY